MSQQDKVIHWKNLKILNVPYGFGWAIEGDPSTVTVVQALDQAEARFELLKRQNEEITEAAKQLLQAVKNITTYDIIKLETALKYSGF
jgi:hypothetical protein